MPIGDVCVRDVVIATKDVTIQQAAVLMRRHHVGDLLVVKEGADGRQIPVGIITDRDIVVSVIAPTLAEASQCIDSRRSLLARPHRCPSPWSRRGASQCHEKYHEADTEAIHQPSGVTRIFEDPWRRQRPYTKKAI